MRLHKDCVEPWRIYTEAVKQIPGVMSGDEYEKTKPAGYKWAQGTDQFIPVDAELPPRPSELVLVEDE